MDTPFERLTEETRAQWLDNPTTQAFFKTLAEERRSLVTGLVNRNVDGSGCTDSVGNAQIGGSIKALDFIVRLAKWG